MSHVGVRVLCIRTHTLRPRRTSTRGILFMVVNVVFTIIASTAQLMYIMPQYATFGAQTYVDVRTNEVSTCTMMGAVGMNAFSEQLTGVQSNGIEKGESEGTQVHGSKGTTTPAPTLRLLLLEEKTNKNHGQRHQIDEMNQMDEMNRMHRTRLGKHATVVPHHRRRIRPDTSKGNAEATNSTKKKRKKDQPDSESKSTESENTKSKSQPGAISDAISDANTLPNKKDQGEVTDDDSSTTKAPAVVIDGHRYSEEDDGLSELEAYMNVLESGNYTNGTVVGDCNPTEMSIMFNNVAVHYPIFGALVQWMTVIYIILGAVYFYAACCRSQMTINCIDFEDDGILLSDDDDDDDEVPNLFDDEQDEFDQLLNKEEEEEEDRVNINGRRR